MLLRVIDFETSGFPPDGKVCQIGSCDVGLIDGVIKIAMPTSMFINPGHAIPPEARAVHHIRDKDVLGAASIDEGLKQLLHVAPHAFVAHNAKFEREFFPNTGTIPWICTRKVAMRLWPDAPNHQNQTLRYFLNVDDDGDFESWLAMPPHRAGPDAYITARILQRALLKATIEEMVMWSNQPSLLPGSIHFGKHKGTPWSQVEPSYLDWLVNKATEMDEDVKFTARHWLARRKADAR
jgi:exodeoxyribonuclease X